MVMYGGPMFCEEKQNSSIKLSPHQLSDFQQIQSLAKSSKPLNNPNCNINGKNDRGKTALSLAG